MCLLPSSYSNGTLKCLYIHFDHTSIVLVGVISYVANTQLEMNHKNMFLVLHLIMNDWISYNVFFSATPKPQGYPNTVSLNNLTCQI